MWQDIKRNWKTNLIAFVAFIYSVPQVVNCIQAWSTGHHCDYKGAIAGILLTIGMGSAKDASNHSTAAEVDLSTKKEELAWQPQWKK